MYFLWQTGVHQSDQEIRCWQLCLYLLLGSPCRIPEVPKLLMANILMGVLLLRAGLADGSQRASLPIRSLYGYFGLEMWDNKRYWTQFLLADIMELRRVACFCTSMLLTESPAGRIKPKKVFISAPVCHHALAEV